MKKLVIDEYREKCDLQKRRLFSIFVRFKVRSVALAELHRRVTGLGLKVLTLKITLLSVHWFNSQCL